MTDPTFTIVESGSGPQTLYSVVDTYQNVLGRFGTLAEAQDFIHNRTIAEADKPTAASVDHFKSILESAEENKDVVQNAGILLRRFIEELNIKLDRLNAAVDYLIDKQDKQN